MLWCRPRWGREGRDKISTCFRVPHQSGSLHEILTIFAVHGLNMVRLESRPVQGHNFEYMFFLEFTGDLLNPETPAVLRESDSKSTRRLPGVR